MIPLEDPNYPSSQPIWRNDHFKSEPDKETLDGLVDDIAAALDALVAELQSQGDNLGGAVPGNPSTAVKPFMANWVSRYLTGKGA
jgi:hypothetical protein